MSDVSLNKTTFDICLILCRNIGHVTSVFLNDMLLWIIPYLHICTVAPISIFVVTQRGSVFMATTIQPIGGRVNWTNHGGISLHRSISLGRSRSRLRSLWLLLLHWILCLAFFWNRYPLAFLFVRSSEVFWAEASAWSLDQPNLYSYWVLSRWRHFRSQFIPRLVELPHRVVIQLSNIHGVAIWCHSHIMRLVESLEEQSFVEFHGFCYT